MKLALSKGIAFRRWNIIFQLAVIILASLSLNAQSSPTPSADVLIFPNGEKLVGHLESSSGNTAKFKSDPLGEVTVDLSKVQEFHTSQEFAVLKKDVRLGRHVAEGQAAQGTLAIADQKVQITPVSGTSSTQPAQAIPVADVGNIIDKASFEQALHHSSIFDKWKGAVVFGSSIVEATQNSLSFNTAANLVRAIPSEEWLEPRDRTTLDFSDSYGKVTQPGTPSVKTSIYHADAERDQYFTPTLYALGAIAFDHNFSQGLELQQLYGGGIGWTVFHKSNQSLDLKGSIDYEKQSFEAPSQDQNLLDSIFSDSYQLKFFKGVLLKEDASVSPAWTNTRAYSAYASVGLTFPVYKRFGFTANVIDSFLNNPPAGFKKNSLQFNTGLTYTLH